VAAANLEHLRTFLTVYRVGSLTGAAALLAVSQPTVTAHIAALERYLGHPLFLRTQRGVAPTRRADEFAREISVHIDAIDDVTSLSAVALPDTARSLHVGGPAEFLSVMLVPRLAAVIAAVGVPVRLSFGLADSLLEDLRGGALDLVVSSIPPRVHGIAATPLYDEEFVLVAAPKWAVDDGADDAADDGAGSSADGGAMAASTRLARIPVVTYADNLPIIRRYWRTVFDHRPDDLHVVAVVPDLRGVRAAVVAGVGMSVLPRYLIVDDLASGALVSLYSPEFPPLNTLWTATRSGQQNRTVGLRALVDELARISS
jgi:DNA-binding transcriptional LysR family regulator